LYSVKSQKKTTGLENQFFDISVNKNDQHNFLTTTIVTHAKMAFEDLVLLSAQQNQDASTAKILQVKTPPPAALPGAGAVLSPVPLAVPLTPVVQAVAVSAGGGLYAGVLGCGARGGSRPWFFRGLGCVFSPSGFLRAYLVWLGFWYPVCTRLFNTSSLSISTGQFSCEMFLHNIHMLLPKAQRPAPCALEAKSAPSPGPQLSYPARLRRPPRSCTS